MTFLIMTIYYFKDSSILGPWVYCIESFHLDVYLIILNTSLCVASPEQANSHSSNVIYHGEQGYNQCPIRVRVKDMVGWV